MIPSNMCDDVCHISKYAFGHQVQPPEALPMAHGCIWSAEDDALVKNLDTLSREYQSVDDSKYRKGQPVSGGGGFRF